MHLASLEQQRELMRYMNSLNEWLGNDVSDRQAEFRGVNDRIDSLHRDLYELGLTRRPCKFQSSIIVTNRHSNPHTFSPATRAWNRGRWFHDATWTCPGASWASWPSWPRYSCSARNWTARGLCSSTPSSRISSTCSAISLFTPRDTSSN